MVSDLLNRGGRGGRTLAWFFLLISGLRSIYLLFIRSLVYKYLTNSERGFHRQRFSFSNLLPIIST